MPPASADEQKKQIEQLQKEKERLDAEKAKIEAEKAKLEAEKAYIEAQRALEQAKAQTTQLIDLQNKKALIEAQKALEQASTQSPEELKELQNKKAVADAQKALADAEKALEETKSASSEELTELQKQVTALQNQKALLDAQKGLSEAQKGVTQAKIAEVFGDVKAGTFSGSVEMKEKAGTQEALLLTARAVKMCAAQVAAAVKDKAEKFYIFNSKEFPTFQRLLTFNFRKKLLEQAFDAANVRQQDEPAGQGVGDVAAAVAAPAVFSAGLEALSKILGFFKTDYTIGSIETKLDDSLLLFAVAGELGKKEVHLPSIFEPSTVGRAAQILAMELFSLATLRLMAATKVKQLKDAIAEAEKQAAAEKKANAAARAAAEAASEEEEGEEGGKKEEQTTEPEGAGGAAGQTSNGTPEQQARLTELNGLIALHDAFVSSLTTADASGAIPLTAIAQELAIHDALKDDGAVLLLRLENSGGSYIVKKHFLAGLRKTIPLYHMGGATVTYLLLKGTNGSVLAGGIIPVHGGFKSTDELPAYFR